MYVIARPLENADLKHSRLREPLLPNWSTEPKLSPRTESESAFDELNCFLDSCIRIDCEQQMKVIQHDNEAVEQIMSLRTIVIEHIKEQLGRAGRLQELALAPCG